jgi:hypothetical protein
VCARRPHAAVRHERPAFVVLGAIVTVGAAILAMMGTHLLQLV